jgi:hypothetical protein
VLLKQMGPVKVILLVYLNECIFVVYFILERNRRRTRDDSICK